jgi:hypothetical protein
MKRQSFLIIWSFVVFLLSCQYVLGPSHAYSQTDLANGVQPLVELKGQSLHDFIPVHVQPLVVPQDIEQFLRKLENVPPDWSQFRHDDMTKQSERLFQLNRQRDTLRMAKNVLLKQPVAFLWAGLLRHYSPEFHGFTLALGPELTTTSWGIVRFKPLELPDYLIAVPTLAVRKKLLARQQRGEHIDVLVLCIGTLVSDESLIYGFSHDGHQDGMILPVVSVQKILYLLKP